MLITIIIDFLQCDEPGAKHVICFHVVILSHVVFFLTLCGNRDSEHLCHLSKVTQIQNDRARQSDTTACILNDYTVSVIEQVLLNEGPS